MSTTAAHVRAALRRQGLGSGRIHNDRSKDGIRVREIGSTVTVVADYADAAVASQVFSDLVAMLMQEGFAVRFALGGGSFGDFSMEVVAR